MSIFFGEMFPLGKLYVGRNKYFQEKSNLSYNHPNILHWINFDSYTIIIYSMQLKCKIIGYNKDIMNKYDL